MSKLTITEALAEIKTIGKRLGKKRDFVYDNLFRQGAFKDALESEGGSRVAIAKARQSILDLENRIVAIRSAINRSNQTTELTLRTCTQTISDWLVWRREVAPAQKQCLEEMRNRINGVRKQAMTKGVQVTDSESSNLQDVMVHIDEKKLSEQIEEMEEMLGSLDGQLSLLNATITIEIK